VIARGTGYIRGAQKAARERLQAHLRYVERASATAGAQPFASTGTSISRTDAVNLIMTNARSARVRYHKIVLSPGGSERVTDWQAWTRSVMQDLGDYLKMNLYWYAVLHTNTDHHHIHLVLAGTGSQYETGDPALIRLGVEAYQVLQKSGHAHSDHGWQVWLGDQAQAVQLWDTRTPFVTLLPGEGAIGSYKELSRAGERGDNLTPHHVPCAALMEKHGVDYKQCIAINVEQPDYGAGRHRLTRSYGKPASETTREHPREALARDIWNLRQIYSTQEINIRPQLQQLIMANRRAYPALFQKPGNENRENEK
jgi:hypothetical protein